MITAPLLIQLSDCHLFADSGKTGYGDVNPYQGLRACLAQAAQEEGCHLVFTGDISGDASEASYRHFEQLVQAHFDWSQVWLMPGNHDDLELMRSVLPEEIILHNQVMYWWDTPCLMVGSEFDGTCAKVNLGQVRRMLQVTQHSKHSLVFLHHHPLDTNSWVDKHKLHNRTGLMAGLQEAGRDISLCHGHIHHASTSQREQVQVLSVPSTCWQWQLRAEFGVADEEPGFRVFQREATGIVSYVQRCQQDNNKE